MTETSKGSKPKKMISRNVAVAFGIICILLAAGLGVVLFTSYAPIPSSLETTYNNYKETHSHTDSDYNSLITQNTNLQELLAGNEILLTRWLVGNETLLNQTGNWLNGNITYYNAQVANLTNLLNSFTDPMLGLSNLTAVDNRTNPNAPFLQVKATVQNFGMLATPYIDPRDMTGLVYYLGVKAYHNDGSVAIDNLDNPSYEDLIGLQINGQSSINVDEEFNYTGSSLYSWTITLSFLISF